MAAMVVDSDFSHEVPRLDKKAILECFRNALHADSVNRVGLLKVTI